MLETDGYSPRWLILPEATEARRDLIRCRCKKRFQGRCIGKRPNLPYTTCLYVVCVQW